MNSWLIVNLCLCLLKALSEVEKLLQGYSWVPSVLLELLESMRLERWSSPAAVEITFQLSSLTAANAHRTNHQS